MTAALAAVAAGVIAMRRRNDARRCEHPGCAHRYDAHEYGRRCSIEGCNCARFKDIAHRPLSYPCRVCGGVVWADDQHWGGVHATNGVAETIRAIELDAVCSTICADLVTLVEFNRGQIRKPYRKKRAR